jgi:hypothetical protein
MEWIEITTRLSSPNWRLKKNTMQYTILLSATATTFWDHFGERSGRTFDVELASGSQLNFSFNYVQCGVYNISDPSETD